jgi:hypothetical protein
MMLRARQHRPVNDVERGAFTNPQPPATFAIA